MWQDPIVAEVHHAREKLAADCNFDIKAFFAGVRNRQATLGDSLVLPKEGPTARVEWTQPTGSLGTTSSKPNPAA